MLARARCWELARSHASRALISRFGQLPPQQVFSITLGNLRSQNTFRSGLCERSQDLIDAELRVETVHGGCPRAAPGSESYRRRRCEVVNSGITGVSGPGVSREEAGAPPRLCGVPWPPHCTWT